jgi:hypothetical protein
LAIVGQVAQVLVGGVRERSAGPHHPGQRAALRLVEHVPQPGLGRALGEVALGRPAALGPHLPDRALDLAAIRQSVLRAPHGAALALDAKDVS